MVLFDTLRASQRLQQAGFEAPKADAIVTTFAEDISERIATKDDLDQLRVATQHDVEQLRVDMQRGFDELRGEIEQLRVSTQQDIEQLRVATQQDIEQLRSAMSHESAQVRSDLRADMHQMEARLIRWIVGTALAAVGVAAALATAITLLLS